MADTISIVISILFWALLIFVEVCLGVYLWKWIAVAIFGLPALSKAQFFGLMVLLHILLPTNTGIKLRRGEDD